MKLDSTYRGNSFLLTFSKSTFFNLLIYKISLDVLYIYFIIPYYTYYGFDYSPSLSKYLTAFFVLLINTLLIRFFDKTTPSFFVVILINLIYFIPGTTYFSFSSVSSEFFIYFSVYWTFFNVFYLFTAKLFSKKKINFVIFKTSFFNMLIIVVVIVSLIMTGYYNNFHISFTLSDAYDLRDEARLVRLPLLFAYFKSFANVFIPVAVTYMLFRKRISYAIFLIFVGVLLFSFGGHKTTFMILIISILVPFIWKKEFTSLIVPAFIALNIYGILDSIINSKLSYIVGFLHRRVMFTPIWISEIYYDYFIDRPDYFRQSILRYFGFTSRYDEPFSAIIAKFLGTGVSGANNGLVGDAVGNFGWIGVIFMPILVILVLRFYDFIAKRVNSGILLVVGFMFAVNFTNSSYFVVLFSHGFILIIISLLFIPKDEKYDRSMNIKNVGLDNNKRGNT